MTTYNTGNPVGSTDARDLYDNVQALDKAVNGSGTYNNRFGQSRRTLSALEAEFPNAAENAATATAQAGIATTQAEVATTQAEVATAKANDATGQASAAAAAKTAAEAARDAAQLSAGVYATTSAGLAGTTNGKYFSVPSGASSEYLILYQNSSGTAVEVKRYPSAAVLDFLKSNAWYFWALEDSHGFAVLAVNNDTLLAPKVETDQATARSFKVTPIDGDNSVDLQDSATAGNFTVEDKRGFSSLVLQDDGTLKVLKLDTTELSSVSFINGLPIADYLSGGGTTTTSFASAKNFDSEIVMIIYYGQSNAAGLDAVPPISTTQRFDNLMFASGVRPTGDVSSFVPMVEASGASNAGETAVSGTGESVKERIFAENGIGYTQQSYQIMGVALGYAAQPISVLVKGGGQYTSVLTAVTNAYNVAKGLKKSFRVGAVLYNQGESDNDSSETYESYKTKLKQMQVDFDADIRAITGQAQTVPMIAIQTPGMSSLNIRVAQLDAAIENANLHMATPGYPFLGRNAWHFSALNQKRLGAYYGLVLKRLAVDGLDWEPLRPLSYQVNGKIILVKLATQYPPVVVDTATPIGETIASAQGEGLSVTNPGGTSNPIIGYSIINGHWLKIETQNDVQAGSTLTSYRGLIRDSMGDSIVFNGGGLNFPMHNWLVTFKKTL